MGYIFLGAAVFFGTVKAYCGKKTSRYVEQTRDAMLFNIIRMVFCILFGFLLFSFQSDGIGFPMLTGNEWGAALLSGASTAGFLVFWMLSVKTGAYMMVEVFVVAGCMIPMIGSMLFFHEPLGIWDGVGYLLLLIAAYLMCTYQASLNRTMTAKERLLLILCCLCSGLTDFSQKIFVSLVPQGNVTAFHFYTYVFALLVLLSVFLFLPKKGQPIRLSPMIFVYMIIMAICLFLHSFFKTRAASFMGAAELYPLNLGAGFILSSVMAATLFHEKPTSKSIAGVSLAFLSLCLIHLL